MSKLRSIGLLELVRAYGEPAVQELLSSFSCTRNADIQEFVARKAMDFTKQGISITYLVFTDNGEQSEFVGIFALANKLFRVNRGGVSNTTMRKLAKFAERDDATNAITMSAPLLAQFGKNDAASTEAKVSGHALMEQAMGKVREAQELLGGRAVYLECEDVPQLMAFYEREGFTRVSQRYATDENGTEGEGRLFHVYVRFLKAG